MKKAPQTPKKTLCEMLFSRRLKSISPFGRGCVSVLFLCCVYFAVGKTNTAERAGCADRNDRLLLAAQPSTING